MFGKQRQGAEITHAPAFQGVEHLLAQLLALAGGGSTLSLVGSKVERVQQHLQGECGQSLCLLSCGNHRDSMKASCGMHCGFGICGHRQISFHSHSAYSRGKLPCHPGRRAIKPLQSGQV